MFRRKGGEGFKGFLNNVKKTTLFLHEGFPYLGIIPKKGIFSPSLIQNVAM